ncbi:MAG: hypothetical protein AAGU14_12230 [Eubacteriaceae bacterium]
MIYFKLTDEKNKGMILRAEGTTVESYRKERGWVRDGILIRYTFPESDTFGMFEEISEEEALKVIKMKNYKAL